jgi:hypothetical protein
MDIEELLACIEDGVLQPGDHIWIIAVDGERSEGIFDHISGGGLVMFADGTATRHIKDWGHIEDG